MLRFRQRIYQSRTIRLQSIEILEALAPSKVYDTSKYIDGLNHGVSSFSLEQLYEVINSALFK